MELEGRLGSDVAISLTGVAGQGTEQQAVDLRKHLDSCEACADLVAWLAMTSVHAPQGAAGWS